MPQEFAALSATFHGHFSAGCSRPASKEQNRAPEKLLPLREKRKQFCERARRRGCRLPTGEAAKPAGQSRYFLIVSATFSWPSRRNASSLSTMRRSSASISGWLAFCRSTAGGDAIDGADVVTPSSTFGPTFRPVSSSVNLRSLGADSKARRCGLSSRG